MKERTRLRRRSALMRAVGLALALLVAPAVFAQTYPAKPVRVIVPFPAAGSSDLVARIVAQKLGDATGQQFLVDNRPGAGSSLGAELASRAVPDGYTLFIGNISPLVINPLLSRKRTYDPVKDFAPVAKLATATTVLVVHPSLPVRSVKDLIALAKARPGELNFGSGGTGTPPHLAGEMFRFMAGVNLVHVSYKGTGQSITDLLAGHIECIFASMPVALLHVKTGRLRALAVTGEKRTSLAPELPTVAESGIPGFALDSWWGLNAPAQTPADIISKLNALSLTLLQQTDTRERFAGLGLEPAGSSSQEYGAFVRSEIDKLGQLIKKIGLRPE